MRQPHTSSKLSQLRLDGNHKILPSRNSQPQYQNDNKHAQPLRMNSIAAMGHEDIHQFNQMMNGKPHHKRLRQSSVEPSSGRHSSSLPRMPALGRVSNMAAPSHMDARDEVSIGSGNDADAETEAPLVPPIMMPPGLSVSTVKSIPVILKNQPQTTQHLSGPNPPQGIGKLGAKSSNYQSAHYSTIPATQVASARKLIPQLAPGAHALGQHQQSLPVRATPQTSKNLPQIRSSSLQQDSTGVSSYLRKTSQQTHAAAASPSVQLLQAVQHSHQSSTQEDHVVLPEKIFVGAASHLYGGPGPSRQGEQRASGSHVKSDLVIQLAHQGSHIQAPSGHQGSRRRAPLASSPRNKQPHSTQRSSSRDNSEQTPAHAAAMRQSGLIKTQVVSPEQLHRMSAAQQHDSTASAKAKFVSKQIAFIKERVGGIQQQIRQIQKTPIQQHSGQSGPSLSVLLTPASHSLNQTQQIPTTRPGHGELGRGAERQKGKPRNIQTIVEHSESSSFALDGGVSRNQERRPQQSQSGSKKESRHGGSSHRRQAQQVGNEQKRGAGEKSRSKRRAGGGRNSSQELHDSPSAKRQASLRALPAGAEQANTSPPPIRLVSNATPSGSTRQSGKLQKQGSLQSVRDQTTTLPMLNTSPKAQNQPSTSNNQQQQQLQASATEPATQ